MDGYLLREYNNLGVDIAGPIKTSYNGLTNRVGPTAKGANFNML